MPALVGALVVGGIGLGIVVAAPVALPVIGFSSSGVVAGSLAAAIQSSIGNVAAGSIFATLQSIGATGGLSWAAQGVMAAGTVAAGAIIAILG